MFIDYLRHMGKFGAMNKFPRGVMKRKAVGRLAEFFERKTGIIQNQLLESLELSKKRIKIRPAITSRSLCLYFLLIHVFTYGSFESSASVGSNLLVFIS